MNRALRLAIGINASGLVKEESKALFIVLEQIKKIILKEKNKD